jgi:hypothetical protein
MRRNYYLSKLLLVGNTPKPGEGFRYHFISGTNGSGYRGKVCVNHVLSVVRWEPSFSQNFEIGILGIPRNFLGNRPRAVVCNNKAVNVKCVGWGRVGWGRVGWGPDVRYGGFIVRGASLYFGGAGV